MIQTSLRPEWAKSGTRVVSSIHGAGNITTVYCGCVGVHFDANKRDKTTDCWYERDANGAYNSGNGIDLLTPEAQGMIK
jgi:hypothetical protein